MDEKEFDTLRDKAELADTQIYKRIKSFQLDMIVNAARSDYDEKEIRGMLKLIAKTDEWVKDFAKVQAKRRR